jgi:hypothetical protein
MVVIIIVIIIINILPSPCTDKVIPVEAWRRPYGSRRLRVLDFQTIGT